MSALILTVYSVTNIIFVLPLASLILHLGYQRWRQQHFNAKTAAAATSHSDIFTYNIVVMEMITVLGCLLYSVGVYNKINMMSTYGFYMFFSTWCVKIHFHALTCVERYLAVVHPVVYLGLKNKGGVRIRNFSIGCVWLMCFVWVVLVSQTILTVRTIIYFCLAGFASVVVCFCCISVLRALRHPSPGEVAASGERVDQMKHRAFVSVMTIMGVLWVGLAGMLVCNAVLVLVTLSEGDVCVIRASAIWFSLPSSFVLPLLYLHRAGKLPGCKQSLK
ncbi:hypothetical protein Q8A73_012630 [Channa argus]|nr:hypothetical protein Q8A73_012630 [Channa argus]